MLRKGRGIRSSPLDGRVGPVLRHLWEISDADEPEEVRRKLAEALVALVDPLPGDLRTVLVAAFALSERAGQPFYQERVHWAATTLNRDDRTVRRRIDEGIEQIAAIAVAVAEPEPGARGPGRGWHSEELRVALALDRIVPEAFEFRRIVADADPVAELDLAMTLSSTRPAARPVRETDLDVDVFHGGVLTGRAMESSDRIGLAVRPARPVLRGERHDLLLRFRATLRERHYVCVPRYPCDAFDLTIRFGTDVPDEVVLLDTAFQDDARDRSTRGPAVPVDSSGEIHVRFQHLEPGFAYGVRWTGGPGGGAQTH